MMYKQLVLCKINRSAVGRVGWSDTGHGTRLARVWHAPGTRLARAPGLLTSSYYANIPRAAKPLNPIENSIEPRLVVVVGLVQDMARSAELKLTHVDGLKLTYVAASITSSKVL